MLHYRNNENVLHWKEHFFLTGKKSTTVPVTQHGCQAKPLYIRKKHKHCHWSWLLWLWWLLKEPFFFIIGAAKLVSACFSLPLNNNWQDLLQVPDVCWALLRVYPLAPEPRDATKKLFFRLRLNFSAKEMLQLVPKKFDRVEIRRFRWSLPPIYSLLFHEAAG